MNFDMLLWSIDRFYYLMRNRLSYGFLMLVCLFALVLFVILIFLVLKKRRQIAIVMSEMEQKQNEIDKITNKLNQLTLSSAAQIDQLNKDFKITINKSEKTIEELRLDIERKEQDLKSKQNSIEKLVNDLDELVLSSKSQMEQLKKDLSSTESKLEQKNQKIDVLNQIIANKSDEYNVLSNEVKSMRLMLDNANDTIQSLERTCDDLNINIERKKQEFKVLQDTLGENESKIESFVLEIDDVKKQIVSKNQELEEIIQIAKIRQQDIESLKDVVKDKEQEICVLLKEQATLNDQIEILRINSVELTELRNKTSLDVLEIEKLTSKVRELKRENDCLTSLNKELLDKSEQEKSITKSDEIRELEDQIQKNEEIIQIKNREIEVLKVGIQEKDVAFSELCEELDKIKSEKSIFEEKYNKVELKNREFESVNSLLSKRLLELELNSIEEDREIKTIEGIESIVIAEDEQVNDNKGNETNIEEIPIESKTVVVKKKEIKTRVEDAIEQSCGCIDFPPIENDSNRQTQRTIEYVYDENNQKIYADEFFNRSAEEIALVSRKMSEFEIKGDVYWKCGLCHNQVKIAHRNYNGMESLFFIHAKRDFYCEWLRKATSSKDRYVEDIALMGVLESNIEDLPEGYISKSREIKENIYALLTTLESEKMGVSDVRMDEIIHSDVSYTKWRRPDLSFLYQGRKVVIELQNKNHTIDTIVDRDIFYRLNNIQIIWVFGSESDTSYDYMRKSSYKNTMFSNHRNVFVFDKDAQLESEKKQILCMKCNWLNADDSWYFRTDNSGTNGKLVCLDDLTYDEEYCKPYYYDANKDYFVKNQENCLENNEWSLSREELKILVEERWIENSDYKETQSMMRKYNSKAALYCVKSLWGFRFNKKVIIPPIFTSQPVDLNNGFYLVNHRDNYGIVNYFGEKVVEWDGVVKCDSMNYDAVNKRILFLQKDLWGVADLYGKELISPIYQEIRTWSASVYRVKRNGKWGLCNIDNQLLAECVYDKIEEINDACSVAIKTHPTKSWLSVKGLIGENCREIYSVKKQSGNFLLVQKFELWGIVDTDDNIVIPCQYEEILEWNKSRYRIKENGKWGVIDVDDKSIVLPPKYDSIGELKDGTAVTLFANVESSVDVDGKAVAQEVVVLQDGLKKTKIAGKWGIVDKNGYVLVNHQYDEIGSFRSRMIGVINNKIIKLDKNYSYPICIKGKYINTNARCHYFSIAGVKCMISDGFLKQSGKSISQLCDNNRVCDQLAFANIIFSEHRYLLRVLKSDSLTKKLSHADGKEDFVIGEVLLGVIRSFKSYAKNGVSKRTKAIVEFEDGRKTMVPRRFFKSNLSIDDLVVGNTITLKKIGFDDELDQTIWEVV